MKNRDFRTIVKNERHRFIRYVQNLLKGTSSLDAEDLVHDVLLKILERADLIPRMDNISAYIYRSLKNKVIDHSRIRKQMMSIDSDKDEDGIQLADILHDVNANAMESLQSQQGQQKLFEALNTLSDIERRVIIAHEFEGCSFKQLVNELKLGQNTLLSHKSRGLRKLRRYLLDSPGDSQ